MLRCTISLCALFYLSACSTTNLETKTDKVSQETAQSAQNSQNMDKNACFSQSPYEVAQSWLDAALAQNDAATAQNELFRAPIWSDGAHIKSFWSDELAKNWSVLIIPKAKNTQDEAVLLILSAAKDGSWQPVSAQPTSATLLWPQM